MAKYKHAFKVGAAEQARFLNQESLTTSLNGEDKPAQYSNAFTTLISDAADSAPLFFDHIVNLSIQTLGDEQTHNDLKQAASKLELTDAELNRVNELDFDQLRQFLTQSYYLKVISLKDDYELIENILNDWVDEHKKTEMIYNFPAFQDYYMRHPQNKTGAPIPHDNGSDPNYSIENDRFRICIKSPYSAISKLFSDYQSPDTPDTPFSKMLLTDLQRARIVAPDAKIYEYISMASHHNNDGALKQISHNNIGACIEDNRLVAPKKMTGHRVFFQKFPLPTNNEARGFVVELQILPQSIMNANDITHAIMDRADELLNQPRSCLKNRIEANFLYNMCAFIHQRCAEKGGFDHLALPGMLPVNTIMNMMEKDQRTEVTSLLSHCQNDADNIIDMVKNGKNIEAETESLLSLCEQSAEQAMEAWISTTPSIEEMIDKINDRIELICGNNGKVSEKDQGEIYTLHEVQRLIFEQAKSTNIFTDLEKPNINEHENWRLEHLAHRYPSLQPRIKNLVVSTREQTMNSILGHQPNMSEIINKTLGLVNAEYAIKAPSKQALSNALLKRSSNNSFADAARNNDTHIVEFDILNRGNEVEFFTNILLKEEETNRGYIGIQRDIFGNINKAVHHQFGNSEAIDLHQFRIYLAKGYEPLDSSCDEIPQAVSTAITKQINIKSSASKTSQPPSI